MFRKITLRCLLGIALIMVGCVAACTATPTTAPSPMPTATIFITLTPLPTSTPTPSVATIVAAPDYMRGCRELYPNEYQEQVGYHGIYPGRTTREEVEALLGPPDSIGTIFNSLDYANASIRTDDDNIVYDVGVDLETGNEAVLLLENIIAEFGCPDLIYAFNWSELPNGIYSQVAVVYNHIGVQYYFYIDTHGEKPGPNPQIRLDEAPFLAYYFVPGPLDIYLHSVIGEHTFLNPDAARIFSWDEVIDR